MFDRFRFPNIIVILVLGIALTGLAIFPASPAGAADTQLKLFVNGREVKPDVPPVLMEGRVLLPIRFVSELVNTPITWEDDTQRILLGDPGNPDAVLKANIPLARVRGHIAFLDVPPQLIQGRSLVPLRFVAETMGINIHWDSQTRSVYLTLDDAVTPPPPMVFTLDAGLFPAGTAATDLEMVWGRPDSKGRDLAGLEWWTYKTGHDRILRAGVLDGRLAAIYMTGQYWSFSGDINRDTRPSQAQSRLGISTTTELRWQGGRFIFNCRPEERAGQMPPLVDQDRVVIFYTDDVDDRIAGVQVMTLAAFMSTDPVGRSGCDVRYSAQAPLPPAPSLNPNLRTGAELHEARALLDLVNLERHARSLEPLNWHEALARIARSHSQDMHQNGFFSHNSPTSGAPLDRVLAAGINPCGVAENISSGYTDAPATHHAWMNSPGHRRNILEPQVRHFGAGIYGRYFTQNFTLCLRSL